MKNFTAGVHRQQREYKSFSPSFIDRPFAWENRQIDQLIEQAAHLLGELNAYAEIVPDIDFSMPMSIAKEAMDSNLIEGQKLRLMKSFCHKQKFHQSGKMIGRRSKIILKH